MLVGDYFTTLFTANENEVDVGLFLALVKNSISEELNAKLNKDFSFDESTIPIKHMHPDKSPGPDDFNLDFFQRCRSTVGRMFFEKLLNGWRGVHCRII